MWLGSGLGCNGSGYRILGRLPGGGGIRRIPSLEPVWVARMWESGTLCFGSGSLLKGRGGSRLYDER